MNNSILSIPIDEAFEPRCRCPVCEMRDAVEEHLLEYITGAAMMEPDVRIETNEKGFCERRLRGILACPHRLSPALILQTRLMTVKDEIFENKSPLFAKKRAEKLANIENSCFICEKVDAALVHTLKTVYTMFSADADFRKLFSEQKYVCIPHYNLLSKHAPLNLKKNSLREFQSALDKLVGDHLASLKADIDEFCGSFDYRSSKASEQAQTSLERTLQFFTGRS